MNDLVQRYIDDVLRRLPKEERAAVEEKLIEKIEALLDGRESDDYIEKSLNELGHPKEVANQYRIKKRYLVSPDQFDDYLNTLKVVAIIVATISIIGGFISTIVMLIMGRMLSEIGSYISSWISSSFSVLTLAFFVITIIFHFIENENIEKKNLTFSIKKLPKTKQVTDLKKSRQKALISLLIEIFLAIIFILLLVNYIDYIGWYENSDLIAQLFDSMYVYDFLPFIIFSLVIHIIVSMFKLLFNYWNILIGILHTTSKAISAIVTLFFLNFAGIFNHSFFIFLAQYTNTELDVILESLATSVLIVSVIIVLILIANLMITWSKVFTKKRLHKS